MDFLQLAKARYSVREYAQLPVEQAKLDYVLQAGRVAPTANNSQPQRLLVIQSPEGLAKLSKACNTRSAPCAIVICADANTARKRPFDDKPLADIDVSIITDHMMLAATAEGLGSLWVCNFNPVIISAEFNLPKEYLPINILLLGYAACEPKSPDRHSEVRVPIENTVFYESYDA